MKRNTKYVGLDVHQAMTVATVRSQGGRVIARSVVETSDESIREFFGAMAGSVHVVFEEGTSGLWGARDGPLLRARAYRAVVGNHWHAMALPHEAQPVGLCRTRRGHPQGML